ncbi:galactokinase [Actinocorallia aurantiaca]|uniref:Galactokinase n=1 Tax=Actinocorallia aurantiaca TaxID=46204 RepID=A0ABN3UT92_9ACTN
MSGRWHAPGRVNLIGEHTDYNDGFVLPFALSQGVTVEADRRDDDVLELRSEGESASVVLTGLRPGHVTGWAAYPAGVAACLREAGYPVGGATLRFSSDLPRGAGLSSSAALECATAVALTGLYGIDVARPELAVIAQRAEHEYAGVPCGIMDQSASLLCRTGHALLLDCRTGESSALPLDLDGHLVLVVDTRAEHSLADAAYAERRTACHKAAELLGVSALRDLAVADLDAAPARLDDPTLRRRTRHVVTENARVARTVRLLEDGDLRQVGMLLTASHTSLREDFEVSWPEADVAVAAALSAGALGARMVGGGFGGSILALVPEEAAEAVVAAVETAFAVRSWTAPSFLEATAGPGARAL